ncbi:MAG: zinc ribbon domain-containing protein [Olsenella sp.]|nr:zinc ribbon domain-containing protein [Olsenella sp.]
MFCPNCGEELKEGSRFCTGCGTELARYVIPTAEKARGEAGPKPLSQSMSEDAGLDNAVNNAEDASSGTAEDKSNKRAKRTGVAALLASTVQLAGVNVPAFALAAAGAVAAGVIACVVALGIGAIQPLGEPPAREESEQQRANREAHEALDSVVSEYREIIRSEDPSELLRSWDSEERNNPESKHSHAGSALLNYYHESLSTRDPNLTPDFSAIRYAYVDIDDDGTDELIVCDTLSERSPNTIIAAYDLRSGNVETFLYSILRRRYSLCSDNVIYSSGDGGVYMLVYSFFKLDANGQKTELESFSTNRNNTRGVVEGTHVIAGEVVEETVDPITAGKSTLTGMRAGEIVDEMRKKYPARTDLDWQEL